MSYRPVDEAFWTDPKVRALSVTDRYLFLYFITNPHASYSGLYYLPEPTAIFETGMDLGAYREGLDTLRGGSMVLPDTLNHLVWVVNMARFQVKSKDQITGARKHLQTIQRSPLLGMFARKYPEILDPAKYEVQELPPSQDPPDTLPTPSQDPAETKELNRELNRESITASPKSKPAKPKPSTPEMQLIEEMMREVGGTIEQQPPAEPKPAAKKRNGWGTWIDANEEVGRKKPLEIGTETKASAVLAKAVPDNDELYDIMIAYLLDQDKFIAAQGWPLKLLPGRVERYRNRPAVPGEDPLTPFELEQLDRDLLEVEEKAKRDALIPEHIRYPMKPSSIAYREAEAKRLKEEEEERARNS